MYAMARYVDSWLRCSWSGGLLRIHPCVGLPSWSSCIVELAGTNLVAFFHKQAHSALPRPEAMACKDGIYPEAAAEPGQGLGVSPRQVLETRLRSFQPSDTGENCARFSRYYGFRPLPHRSASRTI